MHTFVRRALRTALVTGGLVVVGAGAAHAAEGDLLGDLGLDLSVEAPLSQVTEVLPDVSVDVPVNVPVTVSDVAVGVLGDASVIPAPAAEPAPAPAPEPVAADPADVA